LSELGQGLIQCGVRLAPRELRLFLGSIDESGDGQISLQEFQEAIRKHQATAPPNPKELDEAWELILSFLANPSGAKSVKSLFDQLDKDGDSCLSLSELEKGFFDLHLALKPSNVRALYKALDANSDGFISRAEFDAAVDKQQNLIAVSFSRAWDTVLEFALSKTGNKSIEAHFNQMDFDGSGSLNLKELQSCLSHCGVQLTDREVRLFSKSIDLNGDGEISFVEFMQSIHQYLANSPPDSATAREAWEAVLNFLSSSWAPKNSLDLFNRLDRNGDSLINVEELVAGLVACGVVLTSKQLRALHKALDSNSDGMISAAEFTKEVEKEMQSRR